MKATVNPSKSKLVTFGTRHSVKNVDFRQIFLNGVKLKKAPTVKYLGVILDVTLNFSSHIQGVIRTVIHKRAVLSKIMKYLNTETAISVYKAMILPYFDYCDVIYQGAGKELLHKLQRLQNKCLKTCLTLTKTHGTDEVHTLAKCVRLENRRKAHVCKFMYLRQSRRELMNDREIHTRLHDAPVFKVAGPNKEAFKR